MGVFGCPFCFFVLFLPLFPPLTGFRDAPGTEKRKKDEGGRRKEEEGRRRKREEGGRRKKREERNRKKTKAMGWQSVVYLHRHNAH